MESRMSEQTLIGARAHRSSRVADGFGTQPRVDSLRTQYRQYEGPSAESSCCSVLFTRRIACVGTVRCVRACVRAVPCRAVSWNPIRPSPSSPLHPVLEPSMPSKKKKYNARFPAVSERHLLRRREILDNDDNDDNEKRFDRFLVISIYPRSSARFSRRVDRSDDHRRRREYSRSFGRAK